MQGRKVFSLPLSRFQVTGRNVELAQLSRRTQAWVNHWVSPHPTLVPSASQTPASTESYNKTHGPPASMGRSKSGLDCVWGGLGALCSCVHESKWGTATPALAAGALLASRLHPSLGKRLGLCMAASWARSRGDPDFCPWESRGATGVVRHCKSPCVLHLRGQ